MQNQSSESVRLIDRLRNAGTDEGAPQQTGMKAHERLAMELKRQQQEAQEKEKNRVIETPEVSDTDFGPSARERLAGLRKESGIAEPDSAGSAVSKSVGEGDSIAYPSTKIQSIETPIENPSSDEVEDSKPTWQSGFPTNDDWEAEEREVFDRLKSPVSSDSFSPEVVVSNHPGKPHTFSPSEEESEGIEKPLAFAKKQRDMQNWLQRSHLVGDGSSFFERNEMKIYFTTIVLIALLMYWVMSTL